MSAEWTVATLFSALGTWLFFVYILYALVLTSVVCSAQRLLCTVAASAYIYEARGANDWLGRGLGMHFCHAILFFNTLGLIRKDNNVPGHLWSCAEV